MKLRVTLRKKNQNEPYLLACGDNITAPEQISMYLVIDCEIVCEMNINDGVFALLCGFFVFNIHYTPGCAMLFTFIEALLNFKCK